MQGDREDSDDAQSEQMMDASQESMDGQTDYTKTAYDEDEQEDVEHTEGDVQQDVIEIEDDLEQDDDGNGGDVEEDSQPADDDDDDLDITRLRMIDQNMSTYDDPTKSHEDWWSEDKTREPTLCELWQESEWLYDFRAKAHQTEDRHATLRRFATILQVPPHVIDTRMQSLRSQYQKMHRQAKSGSEPEGGTDRQKEILRLCFFLRQHIKTSPSLTNYVPATPVKQVPAQAIPPQKAPQLTADAEAPLDLSAIMDHSLTPMKNPTLTASEMGEDSVDEEQTETPTLNTKHFSRNERLRTPEGVETVVRRSLRLSPLGKKTNDSKYVKSSAKKGKPQSSSTSSCRDTAPVAKHVPEVATKTRTHVLPVEKTVQQSEPVATPKKKGRNQTMKPAQKITVATSTPNSKAQDGLAATEKPKKLTAAQKRAANKAAKEKQVEAVAVAPKKLTAAERKVADQNATVNQEQPETVPPKKKNAAERKANQAATDNQVQPDPVAKKINTAAEKKAAGKAAPDNKTEERPAQQAVDNTGQSTSAADRKRAMASTSHEVINYDVSLNSTKWFEAQGPAYRRAQEMAQKKKKTDPLMSFMQEKAEQMRVMVGSVKQMAERPSTSSAHVSAVTGDTPEQLWANSLVPQLMRMDQDVRDLYMMHAMSLAFKAIRGTWPPA